MGCAIRHDEHPPRSQCDRPSIAAQPHPLGRGELLWVLQYFTREAVRGYRPKLAVGGRLRPSNRMLATRHLPYGEPVGRGMEIGIGWIG